MPLGSTKASRIWICSAGTVLSLLVMFIPFGLSVFWGEDFIVFSFIAWVGLFLAGTFLALLISQLVKIEAEGRTSGKFMGIEVPFEFRGITVLLLGYYVLLAFFYLATDLEGQLSVKVLNAKIESLNDQVRERDRVVSTFDSIHTGRHVSELNMLKLTYHCGSNEQTERVADWNRFDHSIEPEDETARKSIDEPLPVSREEFIYRARWRDESEYQDFANSPLTVRVRLDENGILIARIFMDDPEAYRDLWRHCSEPRSDSVGRTEEEAIAAKADPLSGG